MTALSITNEIHLVKYQYPFWLIKNPNRIKYLLCTADILTFSDSGDTISGMEIYISAKWFFDELDKKLALTKSKMSMRELQDATGVNRAILKKLKDEECTVISSDTMKKLYAYAVAAGIRVQPDRVVRFVVVEEPPQP